MIDDKIPVFFVSRQTSQRGEYEIDMAVLDTNVFYVPIIRLSQNSALSMFRMMIYIISKLFVIC